MALKQKENTASKLKNNLKLANSTMKNIINYFISLKNNDAYFFLNQKNIEKIKSRINNEKF